MFIGAIVAGLFTAFCTQWVNKLGKVEEGTSMGVVFTALFAFGIILIVRGADQVDLDPGCVLYGAIEMVPLNTVSLAGFAVPRAVVMLSIDDTLARKRGLKMFGRGMHHDPLLSSRGYKVTNWGHNWVVLAVIVELPFRPGHYYSLPIMFRLYLNKKKSKHHRRVYRARTELAVEMLSKLCKYRENQRFHADFFLATETNGP